MSTSSTGFNKKLIFTMSTGRCGTDSLSRILNCLDGVDARHEPEPSFVRVMRAGQHYWPLFFTFWIEQKLPYIHALRTQVYAETSHLFIQGFARPLLRLGVVPDIIVLTRPRREVALSMWRGGGIPGRNFMGQRYTLQPDDYVLAPLDGRWHDLDDYSLCYWFTLEIEARIAYYAPMFEAAGARVVHIKTEELSDRTQVRRLATELGLSGSVPEEIMATKWNARNDSRAPHNIHVLELEVRDRVGSLGDTPWAKKVFGGWWDA